MQISTKTASILVVSLTLASMACSSRDKNYDPGTAYPSGSNVMPAPADGVPPAAVAGVPAAPAEPLPPLTPEEIGPTINYTVKKGDSLWLVAKNHKISISRLKRVNNLESDNIQIGASLKIPDQAGAAAPAASPASPKTAAPKAAPAGGGFRRPTSTAIPPTQATPKAKAGSGLKIQD